MQTRKVSGVRTDITTENGTTHVSYRGTRVCSFNAKSITLRSNGWETATTKLRMNQASNQYDLGFSVYQKARAWFVAFKGQVLPFSDGMTLTR